MAKKPVSQSRTMWVKAGEVVGGKTVKKGYLAQYGKPEKRVTARVKIVTATESGKKAGEVYKYKAGRTVKPSDKVKGPKGNGGGGGGGNGGGGKPDAAGGNALSPSSFKERITASRSPKSGTVKMTSDRARTAGRARAMANRGKYQMVYNWETGRFERKRVK